MHNFNLAVSRRPTKKKGHYMLTMTIAALANYISLFISLLHCSSEEYCDCSIRVSRSDRSIRVSRSFKQIFKGPLMGGAQGKMPRCPPLWVALTCMHVYIFY